MGRFAGAKGVEKHLSGTGRGKRLAVLAVIAAKKRVDRGKWRKKRSRSCGSIGSGMEEEANLGPIYRMAPCNRHPPHGELRQLRARHQFQIRARVARGQRPERGAQTYEVAQGARKDDKNSGLHRY